MAGYLFTHFIGDFDGGEQLYFSVSRDGLHWEDLNKGKPVICSQTGTCGIRDPFPVRHPVTGKFYLLATDLKIAVTKDWMKARESGSRELLIWESDDLMHWSEVRMFTAAPEGAGCAWAPEAVFDEERQAFMMFWSTMDGTDRKLKIYAAYTEDFRTFSEPFIYMERPQHVIDSTIVHDRGMYYRFSKDEERGIILMEKSESLTGEFQEISSEQLEHMPGLEGPECYLLADGRTWCLIADRFLEKKGYLPMLTEDLGTGRFRVLEDTEYDMGITRKRHGGILSITDEEYERLAEAYESQAKWY